ncbi:hypothetical protein GCM10009812_13140 [Nocardioides marinus]|uniref:Uncharacterized protein n=1 Tax=Nocardioides marinus TaxID=374514 RepID=A0A7Y9YDI7_9ACTN|nr:hypothetical protein [Nocardioides marinus]NYI10168.1 hypothetical protein [Nocardioides marinus]
MSDDLALARMFRRECSGCGGTNLAWSTGHDFAATGNGQAHLADAVANSGGLLSMRECLARAVESSRVVYEQPR